MSSFSLILRKALSENGSRCPECGGIVRILGHELVCSSCGLVQSCMEMTEVQLDGERIDDHHFMGFSPGIVDGLGSEILRKAGTLRDGKGKLIPYDREGLYLRLGDASSNMHIKSQGSDLRIVRLIWDVSKILNIPGSVTLATVYLYRKSVRKIRRGYVRYAALAACCLIYVTRGLNDLTPISVRDVLEAFARRGVKLRTRDILKAGFLIESDRPIRKGEDYLYPILDRLVALIDDEALRRYGFVDRFLLLQRLLSLSSNLLKSVGPEVRRGRNPLLLASAAIYASSRSLSPQSTKSLISQRLVALASGAVEYSVRETYESLKPYCMNGVNGA